MRVVVVSGIWPPDPGGPASHAPALADFLSARGHQVEVVTTADSEPALRAYPVSWAARSSSRGGSGGTSGAGFGSTETRRGSSPQPRASRRR